MGTAFCEVYTAFLDKISDYDLVLIPEIDRDKMLLNLLKPSCSEFRMCVVDLADRDDSLLKFNNKLDNEIIDILSELMVRRWLKPKVNSTENMENWLGSKDVTIFSPWNLSTQIRKTYELCSSECKQLLTKYSLIHGNISKLKKGSEEAN